MANIVLIGMPSSGKSTIGEQLALASGMTYVDTDQLIKDKANMPLKEIVINEGLERFLKLQETVILDTAYDNYVIATGGSVVYSEAAMKHLKSNGKVIFLSIEYSEVEQRITADRRFARNEGQSFLDIYNERMPLYQKYADITIQCTGKQVEQIVEEINNILKNVKKVI